MGDTGNDVPSPVTPSTSPPASTSPAGATIGSSTVPGRSGSLSTWSGCASSCRPAVSPLYDVRAQARSRARSKARTRRRAGGTDDRARDSPRPVRTGSTVIVPPEALAAILYDCGLREVGYRLTAGGIIALHFGRVPSP